MLGDRVSRSGIPSDSEATMAVIARRCLVSGRVQGVFYRASTREQAQRRQLVGHALNLPDGRVEVLAVGEASAVAALIDWLRQGPPAAHVTDVAVQDVDVSQLGAIPKGFSTR
jgi:acylphosphatase